MLNALRNLLFRRFKGSEKIISEDSINTFLQNEVKSIYENLENNFITTFGLKRCCKCGQILQKSGYEYNHGQRYYCSDDCLHEDFSQEGWEAQYKINDSQFIEF